MSRIHFFGASCPRDHGDGRVVMEAPLEAGGVHGCGRSKMCLFFVAWVWNVFPFPNVFVFRSRFSSFSIPVFWAGSFLSERKWPTPRGYIIIPCHDRKTPKTLPFFIALSQEKSLKHPIYSSNPGKSAIVLNHHVYSHGPWMMWFQTFYKFSLQSLTSTVLQQGPPGSGCSAERPRSRTAVEGCRGSGCVPRSPHWCVLEPTNS